MQENNRPARSAHSQIACTKIAISGEMANLFQRRAKLIRELTLTISRRPAVVRAHWACGRRIRSSGKAVRCGREDGLSGRTGCEVRQARAAAWRSQQELAQERRLQAARAAMQSPCCERDWASMWMGCGTDLPRGLLRWAGDDSKVPSPKTQCTGVIHAGTPEEGKELGRCVACNRPACVSVFTNAWLGEFARFGGAWANDENAGLRREWVGLGGKRETGGGGFGSGATGGWVAMEWRPTGGITSARRAGGGARRVRGGLARVLGGRLRTRQRRRQSRGSSCARRGPWA